MKWTHNPALQVKKVFTDCVHWCHFADMHVMCWCMMITILMFIYTNSVSCNPIFLRLF